MNDLHSASFATLSHPGRRRSRNEDAVYAGPVAGAEGWLLLAVADGLGGLPSGDWASQRAIELLVEAVAAPWDSDGPRSVLVAAFARACAGIFRESVEPGRQGAASTLVAALVHGREVWWANVGDSRLYHVAGDEARQVSTDHSWVAEQVAVGLLDPAEAANDPRRNLVTRTIGFEPTVEVDTGGPVALAPGDTLLLCSDGLHGVLPGEAIAACVAGSSPAEAARRLVARANAAGGPDNITVALYRA